MPDTGIPAGIRRSAPHWRELDALRGIAILLVYAFHLDLSIMARLFVPAGTAVTLAESYVRGGYTGVGLFFVLSGFLLAGEFLAEIEGGAPVSRRRYFGRRALRILPLYFAVVFCAASLDAERASDLFRALPYLAFLNSLPRFDVPLGSFSAVWWSLATEVQFYVVLPFVAWALRPARRHLGLALLTAWVLAFASFISGVARPAALRSQLVLSHSVFGQAPLFLFGAAAAWFQRRYGDRTRERLATLPWARNGGADLALIAALLALGVLLRWTVHIAPIRDAPPYAAWHIAEGAIWTAVLSLVLLAPLRSKPLFCNRPLTALGVISYSIYLVHVPLFDAVFRRLRGIRSDVLVGWTWRTAILAVAASAVCVAMSYATYRLIERPFLVRKERMDR
jgi:peptidoglycan/LPS O-acetylase OafA/YrhL